MNVPALSERSEDIPELVAYFAARQPVALSFTPDALAALQRMTWPGNVRQLRNMVDRLSVFAPGVVDAALLTRLTEQLRKPDLMTGLLRQVLRSTRGTDKVNVAITKLVAEAIRRSNGNRTAAARMLGVHRKVLERRLALRTRSEESAACRQRSPDLTSRWLDARGRTRPS